SGGGSAPGAPAGAFVRVPVPGATGGAGVPPAPPNASVFSGVAAVAAACSCGSEKPGVGADVGGSGGPSGGGGGAFGIASASLVGCVSVRPSVNVTCDHEGSTSSVTILAT